MKAMNYKGYAARIEYSDEDECFVGHIDGIHDVVGFHGDSVTQLHAAVIEAVDDYLATCEKLRRPPKKPYSGKFVPRVPAEMHSRMAMPAAAAGQNLNQWTTEMSDEAVPA